MCGRRGTSIGGVCLADVYVKAGLFVACCSRMMLACMLVYALCVQVPVWCMFAEMLIHFCFGKLLHHPYALFTGKVMPKFSGETCMVWF